MTARTLLAIALVVATAIGCDDTTTSGNDNLQFVVSRGPAVIEEGFRCSDNLTPLFTGEDFVICGPESARDAATAMGLRGDIAGLGGDEGEEVVIDVPAEPRFYEDITPILGRHCWSCHHPEIAETLPLTTYAELTTYGMDVRRELLAGRAPHRLLSVDGDCNDFVDLAQITPSEIATYMQWIDTGMVEGDPQAGTIPEPLQAAEPDVVVEVPSYVAPILETRCVLVDPDVDAEQFVTAFEATTSTPDILVQYYAALYDSADRDELVALDEADLREGWACAGVPPGGRGVAGWVRGLDVMVFPEGTGIPIGPSQPMVIQITARGDAGTPVTAGFSLQTTEEPLDPARIVVINDSTFAVPPGAEAARTFSESFLTDEGMDSASAIAALLPHMWRRGVSIRAEIRRGDDAVCVASAPQITFTNWSSVYELVEPVPIAANDRFVLECVFDTTSDSSPVAWGYDPQSDICMMALYVLE